MMRSRDIIETLMGALVLIVAISFIAIVYKSGNINSGSGYILQARFNQVGGLNIGSDVRVGGVKVGTVLDQQLDQETGLYQVIVSMSLDNKVQLPKDSSAAIVSDGLLGSKYVAIEPGADEAFLKADDFITQTQSAISIEALIGKFMFGGADEKGKSGASNAGSSTPSSETTLPGTGL